LFFKHVATTSAPQVLPQRRADVASIAANDICLRPQLLTHRQGNQIPKAKPQSFSQNSKGYEKSIAANDKS